GSSQRGASRTCSSLRISSITFWGSSPCARQASPSFWRPPQQKSRRCRKKICVAAGWVVATSPRVALGSIMGGISFRRKSQQVACQVEGVGNFGLFVSRYGCHNVQWLRFPERVMIGITMDRQDALLSIAVDLTASLASEDRLARLLDALRQTIPCDAAAVLALSGEELVPLVTHGLAPEVLGRRFHRREHPRLDIVLSRGEPVRFPADSGLPDPYDGLLLANPDATRDVHACLGCPWVAGGTVIGVLTADALNPGAFDDLDDGFLQMLGALAGAALNTGRLIEALEAASRHHQRVAHVLQRDAELRDG